MTETEPARLHPRTPNSTLPWRGLVAFALLGVLGALGPDIAPSRYWPDLDHYIPRYVLLALSVGFGLSAVRSGLRVDRLLGIAVLVVGVGMVTYIIWECLRRINGW